MNNLSNVSEHNVTGEVHVDRKVSLVFAYAMLVFAAVGVIANLYVICMLRYPGKVRITNIYVLNRCLADLLFFLPVPALVADITLDHWMFGDVLCRMCMTQLHVCSYASNAFLLVMSVDCFYAVTHTGDESLSRRTRVMKVLVSVVWVLAVVLAVPYLTIFGAQIYDKSAVTHCVLLIASEASTAFSLYLFFSISSNTVTLVTCWVMLSMATSTKSTSILTLQNDREGLPVWRLLLGLTVTLTMCQGLPTLLQILEFVWSSSRSEMMNVLRRVLILTNSLFFLNAALSPLVYLAVKARETESSHQDTHLQASSTLLTQEDTLTDNDL
ncbi:somatostatin receptor type 2 [Procambarus clarkii]|uniref:somatostatin receptor type 2 n=1 Tax=Procambarus clarkii TaxID=6728 RepID=UPI001E672328|nr:somatostatin receptor type 2-like [Procambarus clarkii]